MKDGDDYVSLFSAPEALKIAVAPRHVVYSSP